MIDAGVETYLVCVDLKQLSKDFAGRRFDHALLAELPVERRSVRRERRVPLLRRRRSDAVAANSGAVGEVVERDGFAFADLR